MGAEVDVGLLARTGPGPALEEAALAGGPEAFDEAGTAPGDRRFRPDVEGLRAVAILLVVLYHAGTPGVGGGYVGVDVFFVISGFVITGVLLRERSTTGRTSLAHFYARRCRRILPAATLVIIVTVFSAYLVLGIAAGNRTAIDSRWAELFLANFHFAAAGTNYLNAHQLPSLLQNFWSLAIEEQFYLVYPTLFLVACSLRTRWSVRSRMLVGLGAVVVASFVLSVIQTGSDPAVAYFSPFTRAWELALGAVVALAADRLVRLPAPAAAAMTWAGLAAIVFAAVAFGATTAYPGAPVAIPVVGAALVIAGGTAVPAQGAEVLLGRSLFGWLGRLSYSLYLWHWPILILAAESADRQSLPFHRNLVPLALALAVSMVTYYAYETPLRHLPILRTRSRNALAMGAALVVLALALSSFALAVNSVAAAPATTPKTTTVGTPTAVSRLVRSAPGIRQIPGDISPPLSSTAGSWGGPSLQCFASPKQTTLPTSCVGGDLNGTQTVVLYGDSHAAMWYDALNLLTKDKRWRFVDLGKSWCGAADVAYRNPPGLGSSTGTFEQCDAFHKFAVRRIDQLQPNLVVITEEISTRPNGGSYTPTEWQRGLERTIASIHVPRQDIVVLGNIPVMSRSLPQCLVQNTADVQACSNPLPAYIGRFNAAEAAAAAATGVRYVNAIPWFCSTTCTAVIGRDQVYFDSYHVTSVYSTFLGAVLGSAIGITPAPIATRVSSASQGTAAK